MYRSKRLEKVSFLAVDIQRANGCFFQESSFPEVESRSGSIKDIIVSLLPNESSSNREYFYEEIEVKLVSCISHHGEEI
jgi:hypothetical protein